MVSGDIVISYMVTNSISSRFYL